jgi:aspartate racemase
MKAIGLIGGLSWESTVSYCTHINALSHAESSHGAKIILYSMDFKEVTEWLNRKEYSILTASLIETAQKIEAAGADCLLLCSNAVHQFAEEVQNSISIPLLHISDACVESIKTRGIKKVALLGTRHIMEQDFYTNRLHDADIDAVLPEPDEQSFIHSVIIHELAEGIISPCSKEKLKAIIHSLIQDGAEGVLLGCTELPLLIGQEDITVPVFDTALLHSQKAVQFAFNKVNI